jgi:2-hydroxycyclohexanecarboxyl-CoA dehydrogenase
MGNILDLSKRTALVTGAGQGVGRQVALHFAANGAGTVLVKDFLAERANTVAAEVEALGCRALPLQGDVTDFGQMQTLVGETMKRVGPIHILVNNAGNAGPTHSLAELRPFWETDPSEWSVGWAQISTAC